MLNKRVCPHCGQNGPWKSKASFNCHVWRCKKKQQKGLNEGIQLRPIPESHGGVVGPVAGTIEMKLKFCPHCGGKLPISMNMEG